ncbi:MAG: peptide chain release factor 2 [Chloroflexi bacterium]|nr:peptide chain release factor 2 [Chloroflexota bacterium]
MDDLRQRLAVLLERVRDVRCGFDLPARERELTEAREQSAAPDLWDDPERAQALMRRVARLEAQVESWRSLERRSADLADLAELADETEGEERDALAADIRHDLAELEAQFGEIEIAIMLGGPYDDHDAVIAIHAGAGGTDAQDWTEILLRMYLRWAERHGFNPEVVSISSGEEAGIKSVSIRVDGDDAYGLLRSERGVHRLVRISPFDASRSRHTSFALVEVMPQIQDADIEIEVRPEDLRVDTYRASGHGGQNVQKNDTAVRLTHLPTGIVVTCQNERSQLRNRESAMLVLKSRLLEIELEKREAEMAELKGEHVQAGWGNQIRSYVLHPYRMVKDLRTGHETSDTGAVLDGEFDDFVYAWLRSQVGVAAAEAAS